MNVSLVRFATRSFEEDEETIAAKRRKKRKKSAKVKMISPNPQVKTANILYLFVAFLSFRYFLFQSVGSSCLYQYRNPTPPPTINVSVEVLSLCNKSK